MSHCSRRPSAPRRCPISPWITATDRRHTDLPQAGTVEVPTRSVCARRAQLGPTETPQKMNNAKNRGDKELKNGKTDQFTMKVPIF
uniref:Uncharacterized protein n=1 Tax=Amphidinium carterae TaxID=2961 RepID=A7YXH8_AMPCA|nr:unknown [Amphidinium carterae]ABV22108.1 unknown [Amphidinium carterae]ABV22110.1 unknown [Amphidinium carterae]